MDNQEILNRFDVLYNNITSSQAPGLDGYEKSVFWNKATLEVLKNHLNPKGNKYGEGFDGSSKRQIEFSSLTNTESYLLFPNRVDGISPSTWRLSNVVVTNNTDNTISFSVVDIDINHSSMLTILNESLGVALNESNYYVKLAYALMLGDIVGFDYNRDGVVNSSDLGSMINAKLNGELPEDVDLLRLINYLLGYAEEGVFVLKEPKTAEEIIAENAIKTERLVVVPINYVEYDTLMSRPYKYPPKTQAWRMVTGGKTEFIIGPNYAPYKYEIRYVKTPKEVNLESNINSEVPEVLHDEILQRAVELAKAAYVGDVNQQQIIQTLGERSE